jgi:hypothetical protein
MAGKRMIWHVGFGRLLRRRGSQAFEVREEVPLSEEPLRIDYLLLRKRVGQDPPPPEDGAWTLRRLWPLLPRVSVVEYKSPGRAYRTGDLDRLLAYVHTCHADESTRPGSRQDLCAVLAVPARTASLRNDVEDMGLSWEDLGGGYWRVRGTVYTLHVLDLRRVAEAEDDDLLQCLGSGEVTSRAAQWLVAELVGSKEAGMSIQDLEGYEELVEKALASLPADLVERALASLPKERWEKVLALLPVEQRLAGLPPEQRLAGLPPEQRLAGLPPEQRLAGLPPEQRLAGLDRDHEVLALPVHLLRGLSEQYIASLSPEAQAEVRRRLRRHED